MRGEGEEEDRLDEREGLGLEEERRMRIGKKERKRTEDRSERERRGEYSIRYNSICIIYNIIYT